MSLFMFYLLLFCPLFPSPGIWEAACGCAGILMTCWSGCHSYSRSSAICSFRCFHPFPCILHPYQPITVLCKCSSQSHCLNLQLLGNCGRDGNLKCYLNWCIEECCCTWGLPEEGGIAKPWPALPVEKPSTAVAGVTLFALGLASPCLGVCVSIMQSYEGHGLWWRSTNIDCLWEYF